MRQNEAVWFDKYGYWRIQVQKDGKRKAFYSSKAGTRGKAEAERKADKWLEDGQEYIEKMTFAQLATVYLAHIRVANGTAHLKREECTLRVYLLPKLGKRKVSSLTNLDYQECIDACVEGREQPLSLRTCGHVRTTINAIWKFARKAKVKMEQPFDLTIPTGATKGQRTILQPNDIRKLFSPDLENYHYIYFVRFMVLTGLRPGEVCGLQNADLTDNILTIRRARNIHRETTAGKNENARRTIILPPLALEVIKQHRSRRKIRPLGASYLFSDTSGGPCNEQAVYKAWLRIRAKAGIPDASLYELRHTMVSLCKDSVPLPLLKQVVGHSDDMDTLGTYGHEVTGDGQAAAAMIDKVFSEIVR